MGEIIIKVLGEGREAFEINLPFGLVKEKISSLKKEEKKFQIKELINKTFNTLKVNEELEKILEKEWHEQ